MEKKSPDSKEDSRWGKGASDLTPDERTIDTKTGFILAASLPLAVLAFWKVTLPLVYFTVSSILGAELLQKINFLSQDVFSLMTSPCPPWISAEQRALLANQSFQQVQRYSHLTQEKFHQLVDKGEPFIVTDAMQAWPSSEEWSCLGFIDSYPDAVFFDWQSHTDIHLEEVLSRSGYEGLECLSGELNGGNEANEKYVKDWVNRVAVPYFMGRDTFTDSGSLTGFVGVQGTGTPPHMEESCMSFISNQIAGVTSWSFSRLMIEGDAVRWSRPVRCFLQPGEIIVWFPSMRFHTEVVDGCSLSFRYGFQEPIPDGYLREVRAVLSSLSENEEEHNSRSNYDLEELNMVKGCSSPEEQGRTVIR